MSTERAHILDQNFRLAIAELSARSKLPPPAQRALELPLHGETSLTGQKAIELLESQLTSRCLDLVARELRARGEGFYTISSAGHEGNVLLGELLRIDDPCVLHYRSAALMLQRARKKPGETPIFDICLSFCASSQDPIAGGRHKVFGSHSLWVPPQTSTIASQLPKAVGMAFSIAQMRELLSETPISKDAIVCVSFGDASANHSTATGAINAALWAAFQHLPVPVLFVCEDNGLGISVRTPSGWIAQSYGERKGLAYFRADGRDVLGAYDTVKAAIDHCRKKRTPTFLHLETVRLLGHAGSDVELAYRSEAEIRSSEAQDPVLATARGLVEAGILNADEVMQLYDELLLRCRRAGDEAATRPRLQAPQEVMEPQGPISADALRSEARRISDSDAPDEQPRHLARLLNQGLKEALNKYPEALVFGEDVARKGGVYGVTRGLAKAFGTRRVFNTLLDEQTILGVAIGAGMLGMLPIPEIQYLAYLHNAEDQLRGEAASLQFFSNAQFANPMVVRIAAYGYQKGFGGHFHNDNGIAVLRDIPSLILASPARGADAVGMLRTCLAAARIDGRVSAFLEPIALYMTRDLHKAGDGLWSDVYPAEGEAVPLGVGRLYHPEAKDLTIISYANGLYLSLQAAEQLSREHSLQARVFDLRWLAPLDMEGVVREAQATGKVLVVDECRSSGSVSEALVTGLVEAADTTLQIRRHTGEDSFIPLGAAAELMMPSVESIKKAALELISQAGS